LGILLASLMTFGNLGERFELLAMKAAGISLMRIMSPLIVLVFALSVGIFYYQNIVLPYSQVKLWTLVYSMRQKSPELDIPEGAFYNEIKGYNVFVRHKEKTGLLKDVMIYDYSSGFNNAMVIMADSGRLKMSDDKMFLVLSLYKGEAFQNLKNQRTSAQVKEAVPYRRETFNTKEILIDFNANFSRTDESFFQNQYIGKNLHSLQHFVDSVSVRLDSIEAQNAAAIYASSYRRSFPYSIAPTRKRRIFEERKVPDSTAKAGKGLKEENRRVDFDSLYLAQPPSRRLALLNRVKSSIENARADFLFKGASIGAEAQKMRRHEMEWHSKFAIAFACLAFFFIGAPLGAIIRKGGLGTPVVLSVLIFIFYYIINNIGSKMARDAVWAVWEGMWLSSFVLAALGAFFTYKAVNDTGILDADTYLNVLKNLIGKRSSRKVERKEVIIYEPDYGKILPRLENLVAGTKAYLDKHKRWIGYPAFWRNGGKDEAAEQVVNEMEALVEELSNSDQILVLNKLMDYPVIGGYQPLDKRISHRGHIALGIFLPFGLPIYLVAVYRRKLLGQDIRQVGKVSEELVDIIKEHKQGTNGKD
ncbi:MAG: LptF/LptG family permease, partial [Tannerella sp.]|nr:LptF/LptG family permease [Tannerella sp.]